MIDKNPFSAEHPVSPEKFAGRAKQIGEFKRFLSDTVSGNSKNIAILGGWGVGKTSLLRVFKRTAENAECAATIIELGEATDSFIALFETIAQNLARDATRMKRIDVKVASFLEGLSLSINYGPLGVSLYERKKVTPNTLKFRDDLIAIHKQIRAPYVIMIDNAEHLINIKGAVFELRNIFQTLQSMDEVNCMLVLSGKENLFSDIRSVSKPAARFFWGIELEPFTYDETREAIEKPLQGASVRFDEECIRRVHEISRGHPYFVQVFAYNLFAFRNGGEITVKDMDANYPAILSFLGKRLFDSLYMSASDNERKIMSAFVKTEHETLGNTEISKLSGVKSIGIYLKGMSEADPPILLKTERGKYKLFHPLFKEYLRMKKAGE